jgi:hypothetical protein
MKPAVRMHAGAEHVQLLVDVDQVLGNVVGYSVQRSLLRRLRRVAPDGELQQVAHQLALHAFQAGRAALA